jgi:hypothetical protein
MNTIGAKLLSISVLIVFLIVGVLLSFIQTSLSTIRILHFSFSAVFLTLIIWAGVHHVAKFNKDPTSRIAWIHVGILSFLILMSSWAVAFHVRQANSQWFQQKEERLKLYTKDGQCKDATEFAKRHPGGSAIWRAQGKEVTQHWKDSGKTFHLSNNAMKILESLPNCE